MDLYVPKFMKVSLVVTALKIPSNNSLCVNKPGLMIFNIKHLSPLSYSVKNTLTLYSGAVINKVLGADINGNNVFNGLSICKNGIIPGASINGYKGFIGATICNNVLGDDINLIAVPVIPAYDCVIIRSVIYSILARYPIYILELHQPNKGDKIILFRFIF